jgi:uncharacterized protein (UPF0332 family)
MMDVDFYRDVINGGYSASFYCCKAKFIIASRSRASTNSGHGSVTTLGERAE